MAPRPGPWRPALLRLRSYGVLNTCYQNCPSGYRDDGVGGTGLTCSAVKCDSGQTLDGLLCYDK